MKKIHNILVLALSTFLLFSCNNESSSDFFDGSTTSENTKTTENTSGAIQQSTFYTIIYDGNGYTSGAVSNQTIDFGSYFVIKSNAYIKDGFSFGEWNTKPDGTGTSYNPGERLLDITTPSEDIVRLYAIWEGNDYVVTLNRVSSEFEGVAEISFDSNGGSESFPTQIISNGNRFVQFPGVPTRDLYAFSGWYYDVDCARLFDFERDLVYRNSTLYAGWEKMSDVSPRYRQYVDTTTCDRANLLSVNISYIRKNYPMSFYFTAFKSQTIDFHYSSSGDYSIFSIIDFSSNNYLITDVTSYYSYRIISLDLEAGHVYRINCYTESYSVDGPIFNFYFSNSSYPVFNNKTTKQVSAGSTFSFDTPKLNGLSFIGWSDSFGNVLTDKNGNSLGVWDIYRDESLYGKWTIDENTIFYELNGGTNSSNNPDNFTIIDDISLSDPLPRAGYAFDGWYLDPTFSKRVRNIINGNLYSDVTLYAKWDPDCFNVQLYVEEQTYGASHTVSFCMNGAYTPQIDPVVLNYDDVLEYPSIPSRSGYIFRGWFDDVFCESLHDFSSDITSDIVLYAGWTKIGEGEGYKSEVDPIEVNQSSRSKSVYLSDLKNHYYYFRSNYTTSASIYYKLGTSDPYISNECSFYIDNLTQGKSVTYCSVKSASYRKLTLKFNAGDVYCMRIRCFATNYHPTFVFYFESFNEIVGTGCNSDHTSHIFRTVCVYYDQPYSLPFVEGDCLEFAGWYDENGIQFTDEYGTPFENWSLLSDIILYAHWLL